MGTEKVAGLRGFTVILISFSHLKLPGGKGTGCLAVSSTKEYERSHGPVTGSVEIFREMGFFLKFFFQKGITEIGFYGEISVAPSITISLTKR